MSECPSLMKRTMGALASVAVDSLRDHTVAQLDAVACRLHQRLSTTPAPSEQPEDVASVPLEKNANPTKIAPAILAGALIGVGVAMLFATKR